MTGIETIFANSVVMATQIFHTLMGPSPQELNARLKSGLQISDSKNRIALTAPYYTTRLGEPPDNLCISWDQSTGALPDGYRTLDLAMPVCDVVIDHLKSDLPILDFRRSTFPHEVSGQQAAIAAKLTNVTNTDGQPLVLIQGNNETNVTGEACGLSGSLGKLIMTNCLDANNPKMTVDESNACLSSAGIMQEVIVTDSSGHKHRAMIDPSSINGLIAINLGDGKIQLGKGGPIISPSDTSWELHTITGDQKMVIVYSGFDGHASITDWAADQLPLVQQPGVASAESLMSPNSSNPTTPLEGLTPTESVNLPTRTITTDIIYLTITDSADIHVLTTTNTPGDTVTALEQVAANPGSTYTDLVGVIANLDSQTTGPAEWTRSWNNFWRPNQKIFAEAVKVNGNDIPPILQLTRLSRNLDDYIIVAKKDGKSYFISISSSDLTRSIQFTGVNVSAMKPDNDGSAVLTNEFQSRDHRYDLLKEFDTTVSATVLPSQWSKPDPSDVELQYMVKRAIDAGEKTVSGFVTDRKGKLAAINIPTGVYGVPGDIICHDGSQACYQTIHIKLVDIPNGKAKDDFISSLRPYFEVIDPNYTNNKSVPARFDIMVNVNDLAKAKVSSQSRVSPNPITVSSLPNIPTHFGDMGTVISTHPLPTIEVLRTQNPIFALQKIRNGQMARWQRVNRV